jgi:hypothetical protein
MFRRIFATLLVFTLAVGQIPALAAGLSPIGVVTQALRANLASASVSAGATVYDGDSFTTASDGLLRVRVGAAQFYLPGQSALNLHSTPGGALAQLTGGTIVFSSAKLTAMEVEVAQARVRPAADQPTVLQISFVGPKMIDIRARRGSVQFSYAGQTQIVPEGAAYRFVLDPSDEDRATSGATSPFPGQMRTVPGGRQRKAFLYFIIGAIGAATYIAIDEALESPSKP